MRSTREPTRHAAIPPILFEPVHVSDRTDGKIAHLYGAQPQQRVALE